MFSLLGYTIDIDSKISGFYWLAPVRVKIRQGYLNINKNFYIANKNIQT